MVAATVNGLSYFVRSEGIQNLLGASRTQQEAIGVPFEVWRRGQAYGSFLVDFPAFFANCGFGALFAFTVGGWAAMNASSLNRFVADAIRLQSPVGDSEGGFQFSIQSLMIATSVVAMFLGAIMNMSANPFALATIFFAGPWLMVGLAMLPPRIHWQHRVVMISLMAVVAIGVAIHVGQQLNKPFDEILMGVFICWTPQSVGGIVGLLVYLFLKSRPAPCYTPHTGDD